MNEIKIALFQMSVCLDKDDNLQKFEDWAAVAVAEGADVLVLPELFTVPFEHDLLIAAAEPFEGGETVSTVTEAAARLGVTVIGGSFPEEAPDGKMWNTAFAVDHEGTLLAKYRKIHLFDPAYPGISVRESESMTPGSELVSFTCCGLPASLAICYDLRFPALFAKLRHAGAKLIFVPAAFNHVSGPAHWELLVRARALDTQSFVIACSPASNYALSYSPWGHSLIVDPWGGVLDDAGTGEGIRYCTIQPDRVDQVRSQIPLDQHARPDVYGAS
jgi:predicted amidohydrolase